MLPLSCRLYRLTGGGFVSLRLVVTAELVPLWKIQHVVNLAFFSMLLGGLFGTTIQRTTEETCRAYGSDRVCRCHEHCIVLFADVSSTIALTWQDYMQNLMNIQDRKYITKTIAIPLVSTLFIKSHFVQIISLKSFIPSKILYVGWVKWAKNKAPFFNALFYVMHHEAVLSNFSANAHLATSTPCLERQQISHYGFKCSPSKNTNMLNLNNIES